MDAFPVLIICGPPVVMGIFSPINAQGYPVFFKLATVDKMERVPALLVLKV